MQTYKNFRATIHEILNRAVHADTLYYPKTTGGRLGFTNIAESLHGIPAGSTLLLELDGSVAETGDIVIDANRNLSIHTADAGGVVGIVRDIFVPVRSHEGRHHAKN